MADDQLFSVGNYTYAIRSMMFQSWLFKSKAGANHLSHDSTKVHYLSWSEEKAMSAVEKEGVPVRHASELYGVPRSTLHDRISGDYCVVYL